MGGEHEPGVQRCELESDNLKPVPVGHRDPPSTGEGLLQVLVLLKRNGAKHELTTTSEQWPPVCNVLIPKLIVVV